LKHIVPYAKGRDSDPQTLAYDHLQADTPPSTETQ